MFFKNLDVMPKHAFYLLIGIIILTVVIIYYNEIYNYMTGNGFSDYQIEPFQDNPDTGLVNTSLPPPQSVKALTVTVKDKNIHVSLDDLTNDRKGYLLVLARFNKNTEQSGALNIVFTNENPNIKPAPLFEDMQSNTSDANDVTASSDSKLVPGQVTTGSAKICSADKKCSYTFTDLADRDSNGDAYYYKIGVGVIYHKNGTDIVSNLTTYLNGGSEYFRIDSDLTKQREFMRRVDELAKKSISAGAEPVPTNLDAVKNVDSDAYMRMLRPYIGNYPDEFTLDKQKVDELTLTNYIDKNYSMGEINVNVDIDEKFKSANTDILPDVF